MFKALLLKYLLVPVALVGLLLGGVANADDNVSRLMKQLTRSSDYKVRISAALSLSKLKDQRAIPSFVKALKDSDKTVRGVAASSLGKTVTSSTKSSYKSQALAALKAAASKDSNAFVRKQAQKAYNKVKAIGSSESVSGATGGTYVNIGVMSAKVPNSDKIRVHMRKTVQKTFKKKASSMMIEWPGGKLPSKGQLSAKKIKAFHVDGTLNELSEATVGRSTTITCKVSMLIATYVPQKNGKVDKSMFGFLKGGASVQASSSPKEVQYAREDCVSAVMEDLVARKIIPTLKARP